MHAHSSRHSTAHRVRAVVVLLSSLAVALATALIHTGTASAAGTGTAGAAASPAIAYRSSSSATARARQPLSIPVPAGVAAGDVLVASINDRGWSDVFVAPAGWMLVRDDLKSTLLRQSTYVHVVGSQGEPAAYTWKFAYGYGTVGVILAYSGVDNTNPVDAASGQTSASSTSITAPSVTTTTAGDVVIGMYGTAIATAITPPTGLTGRIGASRSNDTQTQAIAAADIPAATVGATGATVATAAAAAANIGHTLTLRPAAPGTPPPPSLPIANDDTYSVAGGQTLSVTASTGVLANDSSPSGGTLTAALVSTTTHGSLTLTADGAFNYVPAAGYTGPDAFTYTASDANGTSPSATARITVTSGNHPPTVTKPADQANTEGDAASLQIQASDPDPGDALSYAATGLPSGLSISSTGLISGVVAVGASTSSPFSVTITVTDKANATATTTFTWTVTAAMTNSGVAGLWHMDETSGTTMTDSSGNHNNGALTAVTVGVPGWLNNGYRFNGSSSIGIVSDAASLNPGSNDFSFELHVKFTAPPPVDYDLFRKGLGSTAGGDYKLEIFPTSVGSQGSCVARGSSTRAGVTAGPDLADGQWHTLGCTKTARTWSLVVDGVSYSQQRSLGSLSNSADIEVGAQRGNDFYNGVMDEVTYRIG